MTQWRRVRSPYATPAARLLPKSSPARTASCPRGRADRRWSSKPADAGSTPAEDSSIARERLNDSSLVMRLASQLHCLWSETGSIPVRGAGPSARTSATSAARRLGLQSHGDRPGLQNPERGFDSFAARRASGISTYAHLVARRRGGGSTGEHCTRTAEIGVRFPVAPLSATRHDTKWDRSSARRAPRWHRGGCRCESGRFHQLRASSKQ